MVRLPFVGVVMEENFDDFEAYGGVYYVIDDEWICEEIAKVVCIRPNELAYTASEDFIDKYAHFFPLGILSDKMLKEDLDAWINKMIWFSFLDCSSRTDVGHCWFVKDIMDENLNGYELRPSVNEGMFGGVNTTIWVLLKNGNRIWPVQIVNNRLCDGWSSFWSDNGLQPGYKLVFGFDRDRIFDVIVLNDNLDMVKYETTPTLHNLINDFPDFTPSDALRTSCFPSYMFTKDCVMQFGYVWGTTNSFFQVLSTRLANFLDGYNIEDVSLCMQNRWWIIGGRNGRLDRMSVKHFLKMLHLQPLDFLLVTVFEHSDIRIIVFNENEVERGVCWATD